MLRVNRPSPYSPCEINYLETAKTTIFFWKWKNNISTFSVFFWKSSDRDLFISGLFYFQAPVLDFTWFFEIWPVLIQLVPVGSFLRTFLAPLELIADCSVWTQNLVRTTLFRVTEASSSSNFSPNGAIGDDSHHDKRWRKTQEPGMNLRTKANIDLHNSSDPTFVRFVNTKRNWLNCWKKKQCYKLDLDGSPRHENAIPRKPRRWWWRGQ